MTTGGKPLAAGDERDVKVEKLALGGRSLARVDGMALFLDRGLPGERVAVKVEAVKKRYAEGRVLRTLAPADTAKRPFCQHFGACGGCDWQELPYPEQLAWKRTLVAESLAHIGGARGVQVEETVPSPATKHHRNKMEFSFAGVGQTLKLGLRPRGSDREVVDVAECPLLPPPAGAILETVRAFCRAEGWGGYIPSRRLGFLRHLVLRVNTAGEWMVHLITTPDKRFAGAVRDLGLEVREKFPQVVSFVQGLRGHPAPLAKSERAGLVLGRPTLDEELAGLKFTLSPDSFFQTNTGAAEGLVATVLEYAAILGPELVYDLCCGAGTISLPLAARAREVVGFELDPGAVRDATANAKKNGLMNARFVAGDIASSLPDHPVPDVVVADPPRGGLPEAAVDRLLELAPGRIVYVSCNPATLARDASRLAVGYELVRARPVDMFPHAAHVEAVALFLRRDEG